MTLEETLALFFADKQPGQRFKDALDEFEKERVRIALIGRAGTGKSSLINALYGARVAQTGATETTQQSQEHDVNGLTIVDFPGCSTVSFPRESYVETMNLAAYDVFVLVVAKRVLEDDVFLFNEIRTKLGKVPHVVRSMIDQDLDNAKRDGKTQKQVAEDVRKELNEIFPNHEKLWLVSSAFPTKFDFTRFEQSIYDELSVRKREKFIVAVQAYTEKQLEQKKEIAKKQVMLFSGLAAANGFNPIPGADLAADIAIITQMNSWILKCFKLDGESLEKLNRLSATSPRMQALLKKVLLYGTKEFAIATLKRSLGKTATSKVTKWLPIVGNVASAGIGFAMAQWMGHDLIERSAGAVKSIILAQKARPAGRRKKPTA